MKFIFVLSALLIFISTSYSQQSSLTKEDYLLKSRHKKTTAFVLLGSGAVLIGAGFVIANSASKGWDGLGQGLAGVALAGGGAVLAIVSFPFFMAADRNKKRAALLSIKSETNSYYSNGHVAMQYYPALSFKVRL
ncbi:MAG: hypothetical protein V4685_17195 [Bacteroidota bacterium]